jgi:protein-tyrosine-phosphatase/phosphohistidine swiveling domain-containing protein
LALLRAIERTGMPPEKAAGIDAGPAFDAAMMNHLVLVWARAKQGLKSPALKEAASDLARIAPLFGESECALIWEANGLLRKAEIPKASEIQSLREAGWTEESKDAVRDLFLGSPDPALRKSLLALMSRDFGFENARQTLHWLYPDYSGEIDEFHPGAANRKSSLSGSYFSDPAMTRAWAENVRELRARSLEQYAILKNSADSDTDSAAFGFYFSGREPSLLRARLKPPDPKSKLKARYAAFDGLIEANFRLLEQLSSLAGKITRDDAAGLFAQARVMAEMLGLLEPPGGDGPKGGPRKGSDGTQARMTLDLFEKSLAADWERHPPQGPLPEEQVELLTRLNPQDPFGSLHSLVNWMHQKALSLMTADQSSEGGSIHKGRHKMNFAYLGDEPAYEALTSNPAVRGLLRWMDRIQPAGSDFLMFSESRAWLHLSLGCHSAEIFADASNPDEGGMLRIRYQESGADGADLRLLTVASLLERLGIRAKIVEDSFLEASWDKDHGLASRHALIDAFPFVVRFLRDIRDLDLALGALRRSTGKEKAKEAALRLGEIYAAEGAWPFPAGNWRLIKYGLEEYEKKKLSREARADKLNARLTRLGLPPIPEGVGMGDRTVELFFTRPIEEAAARGEVFSWEGGRLGRLNYRPVDDLVGSALKDTGESLASASVLANLEEGALDFKPIGKAGSLQAERAQLPLPDGSILTVHILRDPASGRPAYAWASLWPGPPRPRGFFLDLFASNPHSLMISADKLRKLLGAAAPEDLSDRQKQHVKGLLEAKPAEERASLAEAAGLGASPGVAVGPVTFDKANPKKGSILAVPYTTPDDLEAISRCAGVLATGGGSLSHAAITTRELGIPSIILHSARWQGTKSLGLPLARPLAARSGPDGVRVVDFAEVQEPVLREGDLVRIDGRTGTVRLLERTGDGPLHRARAALERLLEKPSAEFDFEPGDPEVERFLLEESRSNPRYGDIQFTVREELSWRAKSLSEDDIFGLPRGGSPLPEPPKAQRPLWSLLEKKLAGAPEKEALRAILNRNGRLPGDPLKILFLCTSNTCRSPLAEQITRHILDEAGVRGVSVLSRALFPMMSFSGDDLSPRAREALETLGIHARPHSARQVDPREVREADLILTMEDLHTRLIADLIPESAGKAFLLNDFSGLGERPIDDPMAPSPNSNPDRSAYDKAAHEIFRAAKEVAREAAAFARMQRLFLAGREAPGPAELQGTPSLLPLKGIDGRWTGWVGGKSAKLGELSGALGGTGAGVPDGFALTRFAYERFLEENGLKGRVAALAERIDSGGDPGLSDEIRGILLSGKLSPDKGVGLEIMEALKPLQGRLAVRSSAIQEDGDDAAFAGAAESYLNAAPGEVLGKVVENWASFWLPRGVLYRRSRGLKSADLQPATLIQEMAPAEISGVIFTKDPVDGAAEVVINAAYGLGEGVVSGKVASDAYFTNREDGRETRLPLVASKRSQVSPEPGGSGTTLSSVPKALRKRRALTQEQTRALTQAALAIEDQFGRPMDIEFSISNGRIVILQARPVTTLPGARKA